MLSGSYTVRRCWILLYFVSLKGIGERRGGHADRKQYSGRCSVAMLTESNMVEETMAVTQIDGNAADGI